MWKTHIRQLLIGDSLRVYRNFCKTNLAEQSNGQIGLHLLGDWCVESVRRCFFDVRVVTATWCGFAGSMTRRLRIARWAAFRKRRYSYGIQ